MAKVEVSRGVLMGLGVALGTALLALVFLLGRETGRRPAPPLGLAPAPASPSAPAFTSAAPLAPAPAPAAVSLLAPSSPSAQAEASTTDLPASPVATQDPQRAAVAAFFAALDRIGPGQFNGDPQAAAQDIVSGLGKGDFSGFDQLIAQAEEARRRLASLAPPPPCVAFQQETLAQLDESLALMRDSKKALEGGGRNEGSLATRAQSLQTRSDALQREEKELRRRYGIAQ